MFKLESYITPILLSYVDKYIKNFKPEDTQLSLWGGEVALHNLDLRLEVLEDELQLPFTFVSGHIHELIIHVPWTKLYSEPICITINTIECILKLRGQESSGTDVGGSTGGSKERQRRPNKNSDAIAPPGYVQTMVNKIVSNITINCCNLIVKYVEEDIVMSMNVKNLTFQSANEKWEPEFSDFISSQLMLRKIIKLSDVTVCLDKRNASGKIDSYQEPVLYRCSLILRLLKCYNSASAHRANVSRLDIHCQKMTFSISELQVPMMIRLLLLARALQNREVGQNPVDYESHADIDEGDEGAHEIQEQDSWTGWAWNLVPTVLPNWSENWDGDESEDKVFTFHSGIYIDDLAFNLRMGDCGPNDKNSWKNKVEPFLTLSFRGCFLDYVCHDNIWVNSQLGISRIQLEPMGPCSCGVNESVTEKDLVYYESGSYQEHYLSESLFSSSAIENCGRRRKYNLSWDIHQNIFSESRLLEKTPALAIDYLYMVELTEKYSLEKFLELNGDLEYSDLPEHALCRSVMGPFILRVNSGLLHRTEKVQRAAALYDYQPYASPPPEDRRELLPAVTTEEYDSLEENIPLRTYQYTVFQPKVEFHLADHTKVQSSCKRKMSAHQQDNLLRARGAILSLECQCMDARFISPMYSRRLVRSACLLPNLPQLMFHACHSHSIGRILGLTFTLSTSTQSSCQILSVNNLLCKRKELFFPHLWEGPDILNVDCLIEAENATLTASKAQLLLIYQIVSSLTNTEDSERIMASSLIGDAFTFGGRRLEVIWKNLTWQEGLTLHTRCDTLSIAGIAASLVATSNVDNKITQHEGKILIFSGPTEKNNQLLTSSTPFLKACIQWPQQTAKQSHAPLLVVNVQEAVFNVDQMLYSWLLYIPSTTAATPGFTNSTFGNLRSTNAASDVNAQSVRSSHRKISDVSGSFPPCERTRRSQTPLSVHSSEKDRETVPPPLVTQLSAISLEQSSVNTKPHPAERTWQLSKWLVQWFPVWQGLVVSIDVAHWQVHLPISHMTEFEVSSSEAIISADRVCIQLPVVQISSATSSHRNSQLLFPPPSKLPVHVPPSIWADGTSNFPWNISLCDLSVWTLSSGKYQYLLKPVTTKCTVGISTRFANGDKGCITSLGLCIHNDTGALHVTFNQTQVQLLSNVLFSVAVVTQYLRAQHCGGGVPTPAVPPLSPTTISESASVSESKNLAKNSVLETNEMCEEPVKLSVWLQCTLARMTVNLYQQINCENNLKKSMKLSLEVEDLMTALDLQQIYSKLKLKVAGANIHHYVKSEGDKTWQLSPYQGLVLCSSEETSPSSSVQVPTDEGCGLLTATLTRAKCRNVHTRWGATMSSSIPSKRLTDMKVHGQSNPPEVCFITEMLVKLQPLDFLLCMETLTQWSSVLHPFSILFEEFSCDSGHSVKSSIKQPSGVPKLSSASLPLLYLDLQAVRVIMPLNRSHSYHDTFIVQVDSVTLSPHAENPLWRTPIRPDVFHMAEQARILTIPGSEVEDRQYELNILGFAISTGRWYDMERCRRLSATSPASSLRTMSENPALVWNSLSPNSQSDASEIVGGPKPDLTQVLAPMKICLVAAPAIVYRSKVLVCGHALEINAVSDIDVQLTTNQMRLAVDLISEVQRVSHNFSRSSSDFKPLVPSFLMELAQKQYHRRACPVTEQTQSEQTTTPVDSGVDMAEISSIETPHSSRLRGLRRVSRSPRYLESVHGPSVHSAPFSQSWYTKQDRDGDSSLTKGCAEQTTDLFVSSRSSQKDRASTSPEQSSYKERQIDFPLDFLITGRKISLLVYEDAHTFAKDMTTPCESVCELRPLLYILVTQPHMFYSHFNRSCSVQISIYNTIVKLGSPTNIADYQPAVCESDFPLTLFESCKGDADLQTGVPPALCTIQWTLTPTKPAQVSVDFGRPAKFVLSIVNLGQMHHVLDAISNSFMHDKDMSTTVEPSSSENRLELALETLSGVSALNFKSVQIVIAFHAEDKDHIGSAMEVCVSSLCGDLMCTSRTRWGCNVSTVERIVSHLTFKGLSLLSSNLLPRELLLQPCNMDCRLELLWPVWLPRSFLSSLPHSQLTIQSEYVALTVSPDHLRSLHTLYEAFIQFSKCTFDENVVGPVSSQHMSRSTPASEIHSNETDFVDPEQHYTDDLRAGAFQFMDGTNTLERDQLPLPYQCVFWESSPPAIAWRYPQPRSLTNVLIFPVPFKSAPGAEVGKEDAPVVVCSLQYWSECRGSYQHYATFLLSETSESRVDLPITLGSAVSSVWRVLLAGTQDIHGLSIHDSVYHDSLTTEVPVVSPRALAACMRVDSFFSAALAPNLQACINLNSIQISLKNQQTDEWQSLSMPPGLEEFSIDGKIPFDQSFLWLSLNHFALFYSTWPEGRKIVELNSLSRLEILDYATLCQQNVVDPFLSRSCIYVNSDGSRDVSIVSRPIACRIGPSVTHTLSVSLKLWQQELALQNSQQLKVFTTQYVLCNDVILPILIGQADTDEQILLSSRQCHLYSWRSSSKQPVLRMSVMDPSMIQLGNQLWSSPFSIDSLGTVTCEICVSSDKKIIVFVKIHELSATQKQVTLSGQLQVLNHVDEMLHLRIIRSSADWSLEACGCMVSLQPSCMAPSFLLDRHADDPQLSVRLRIHRVDVTLWTGDVPLRENPKTNQPWLVKVPLQEKHQFICLWCRVVRKNVDGHKKILLILSPMYAIQSFLPTPALAIVTQDQHEGNRVSFELKGQGDVALLHVPGALKESAHQLHFKTSANVKIFPFSYSYVDQKQLFQSLEPADFEKMLDSSPKPKSCGWPLPDDEFSTIQWIGVEVSNSYVQASYGTLDPYSGTMLLELHPWALLLNMLGCDVCVEQSDNIVLSLPSKGVAAPPKLEGTFHLGLKFPGEERWSFSDALQLARADWSKSFYMPRISGLIPIEGHVQLSVKCELNALSLLTLGSQIHNKVRVVRISSSFIVSNSSSYPLQVTALAVRHNDMNRRLSIPKLDFHETINATIDVLPNSEHRGYPLVRWLHIKSCEADVVPYVSVSMKGARTLGCPLRISGYSPRRRFTLPLLHKSVTEQKSFASSFGSLVLCVSESNGQTFLNISDEPHPQIVIHNFCDVCILCVEVSPVGKASGSDFKIIQDNPWDWFCCVDPSSHVAYNMPSADNLFPQIPASSTNYFVSLAVDHGTTMSASWSSSIQLNGLSEQFISLPGHGDVKIHTWMEGHTTHLSIEAVSRVEICAKDIRSRLQAVPEYPLMPVELDEASPFEAMNNTNENSTVTHIQEAEASSSSSKKCYVKHSVVKFTAFVQSCSCTLTAPVSVFDEMEVSVITLDHIAVSTCPVVPTSSHASPSEISIQITLGDFQFDNQLFERGGFDFPVVLMGQQETGDGQKKLSASVSLNVPASQLVDKFSRRALLAVNATLESNLEGFLPKSVHVSLGPITAFIEDKYILDLRKHIVALLSPVLTFWLCNVKPESTQTDGNTAWISAPLPICLEFQVLKQPLRLTSLTLDPVWLLLSVHSSMRLYIALDRSPLQFTQFCRRSVFTTSYNLGHTLSMHYLSGAIFGAGWVVGSLELLGSPGGFARTVGTGLRDFVSLPYHGILQGPWGFLVGITHGSASLMKHFTAGTLTSVTKMASSVARNLDRLTLDAEHLERTEEMRRVRPQGVAEGLIQGLTGLGISLLGAVGGIAHHPLQSVLSGQATPKGVVTGVGRGLVGVFTKPLSGAADLVALTGQGLLQGAGWSNLPKPRQQAKSERGKSQGCALSKYRNKIQRSGSPQCLLGLDATLESGASRFRAVTLILTAESLVILSADGDNIESQLALTDLILPDGDGDPTMLTISFKGKGGPPTVDQRMWDFVNGCRYGLNTGPPTLETSEDVRPASPPPLASTLPLSMQTVEHQSAPEVDDANPNINLSRTSSDDGEVSLSAVQPAESSASSTAKPPIVFYVNPQIRNHFLILLKVAQRQLLGQGFQVL